MAEYSISQIGTFETCPLQYRLIYVDKIKRYEEIEERVMRAGLRRIRPTLMTTFTTLAALTPILLTTGRGSDVMTPMALPVFGGMVVALISIFVVPTCYCAIKQMKWRMGLPDTDFEKPATST